MVAIKNLLVLVAAASAALLPRDVTTVQNDLKTIDSDVNKLTAAVKSWDGTVGNVGPIQNAESQVETDLKNTNKDAQAISGTASSTDSKTLITYINGTLRTDIETSLSTLNSRKAQFTSGGLNGVVKQDLQNLKNLTDTLGATLISKSSSDQTNNAKAVLAKLDQDFNGAIANFS